MYMHNGFNIPENEYELGECLKDVRWRILSGALYHIKIKGDEYGFEEEPSQMTLIPEDKNPLGLVIDYRTVSVVSHELNQLYTITQGNLFSNPQYPEPKEVISRDEFLRRLQNYENEMQSQAVQSVMTLPADAKVIETKPEDANTQSFDLPFRPNQAQVSFIENLWYKNVILKARQLGFTTLIAILWLDHAMWVPKQSCAIVAQDLVTAQEIFEDKIKYAYDNLPEALRSRCPLLYDNKTQMKFAHNGSVVKVGTSFRGGTNHRLHVSEFGKICAESPDKAVEVMTGSMPSVPANGITIIESTAEGPEGYFAEIVRLAQQHVATGKKLTHRDFKLHFYAWWMEPKYVAPPFSVNLESSDHEYFDKVEAMVKIHLHNNLTLTPEQKAWYVTERDGTFLGDASKMWQEYPSYPDEAFQVATDGNYYANDMLELRKRNGIKPVPELDVPVTTFWDIGNNDGCAIWFHQEVNGEDRFIDYHEGHGKTIKDYCKVLQDKGYVYNAHYMPHDANHKRLGDFNKSTLEQFADTMPNQRFYIIPKVTKLISGIVQARKALKNCWFDNVKCAKGVRRLDGYRKKFSKSEKKFIDLPDKSNGCSEGADAFRQFAQAKDLGLLQGYARTVTSSALNGDTVGTLAPTNHTGYKEAPPPDWRLN